jgi:hypothetical protein
MPDNSTFTLQVLDESGVGIANYTAGIILTANESPDVTHVIKNVTADGDGILTFDFSSESVITKYSYTVTVTGLSQEINSITYLAMSFRASARLRDDGRGGFSPVDLRSTTVAARADTVTLSDAVATVQTAYDAYLTAKQSYEELLANATTIELNQLETYEPANPTYIVTRLLEFQTGTLGAAIRYADDANLSDQLALLQRIDRSINQYVSYYPNVSINDGEGIPYNV